MNYENMQISSERSIFDVFIEIYLSTLTWLKRTYPDPNTYHYFSTIPLTTLRLVDKKTKNRIERWKTIEYRHIEWSYLNHTISSIEFATDFEASFKSDSDDFQRVSLKLGDTPTLHFSITDIPMDRSKYRVDASCSLIFDGKTFHIHDWKENVGWRVAERLKESEKENTLDEYEHIIFTFMKLAHIPCYAINGLSIEYYDSLDTSFYYTSPSLEEP